MELPHILLIGRNGQVGWELCRTLAPMARLTTAGLPRLDLNQPDAARNLILQTRPDVVVNAAAYTAVDKAESDIETARRINALAPGEMASAAAQIGAWMVHFSTDYVFDGAKREPYVETDPPNPLSVYGRTKLEGEEAVRSAGPRHLIFRLCWVYGLRGQNFLLTIRRLAREQETLRVVRDQFGCPTWSRLIAETVALALRTVLSAGDGAASLAGTYHLAAAGYTNWHTFASHIVELMPPGQRRCRQVEAITSADYPTPARRPAWSVLDCRKLKRIFGLALPDWQEGLRLAVAADGCAPMSGGEQP